MLGFIVADFLDAPVRGTGHAYCDKVVLTEEFDGTLVKFKHDPLGREQVLPGEVVDAQGLVLGCEDGIADVLGKGPVHALVAVVHLRLTRDRPVCRVGQLLRFHRVLRLMCL